MSPEVAFSEVGITSENPHYLENYDRNNSKKPEKLFKFVIAKASLYST